MDFKVYIKTDKNNCIKQINSSFCLENTNGWTEIDEGDGVRYMHAQTQYLSGEVTTKDGIPCYKLVDGKVQARTEEEIQADRDAIPAPIVPPTNAELEAENKMLRAQLQAAVDRQDFIEDCIAEMAMQVYAV